MHMKTLKKENKNNEEKRLLAFCAYYEPEIAASLYLSSNLYEDIAYAGWKVDVYTPMPTRGVSEEVRITYYHRSVEKKGNLTIHRIPLMREGKRTIGRALRYILMNLQFICVGLFSNADVIYAQSTPPTQGLMAGIISKIKGIPFVYNLQDIFPDSLVKTDMTREGSIFWKIGRVMENFSYKNACKIITISGNMKENILAKGVPEDKVRVISNWIDTDTTRPIPKDANYMYEKYDIDKGTFNVVYAGNLGHAQNIEVMLNAAKRLENIENIRFIIFGQGSDEKKYKDMADKLELKNTKFLPLQPYSEVPYVYSLADTSIVSCKEGFAESAMPSKTWSIMACGVAVLACFDKGSELQKIVENNSVGLFSVAGDDERLSENILKLYNDRQLCLTMGINARQYAINNVSRSICVKKYIDEIEQCAERV